MATYLRNRLTLVWLLLSAVTIASWALSRDSAVSHRIDAAVTIGVLLMAALKSQLVIRHFMEVRTAPRWLRLTMAAWLAALFALLLGGYLVAL